MARIWRRSALVIGVAVAVLFLWLALRGTDPALIAAALRQSNPAFLVPMLGVLGLYFWLRAMRWAILLHPVRATQTATVFPATVIGYMGNLIFPAYIGELGRVYLASRQLEARYAPVLVTLAVERVFDFLSVLFFVGAVLILEPNVPNELHAVGYVALGGAGLLSVALILFQRLTPLLGHIARRPGAVGRIGARVLEQAEISVSGIAAVSRPDLLIGIVVTSLLQWAAMGICLYVAIVGVGIDASISAGFIVLALTVAGMTLPSSPGFFGTIQLCFSLGLVPFGVAPEKAFAASVFYHLPAYLAVMAAGLFLLKRAGQNLRDLQQDAQAVRRGD
ncbi:MAG: lysylphosphatidylglycerol synthase transmembrane domain-containing protein [Gammaproteobacteria bacterium]|nr:lysylphosphatidylglycerol synthase transmembrane domain-containing protein [Gammaproteobacteria bacterium]